MFHHICKYRKLIHPITIIVMHMNIVSLKMYKISPLYLNTLIGIPSLKLHLNHMRLPSPSLPCTYYYCKSYILFEH